MFVNENIFRFFGIFLKWNFNLTKEYRMYIFIAYKANKNKWTYYQILKAYICKGYEQEEEKNI